MKNTSHSSPTGSLLVGMAAGAALGAVGTCQLDKMVDNFVEQHMDS